eukprot:Selendium_serpulae@DN10650_c0_g1_i1.p1
MKLLSSSPITARDETGRSRSSGPAVMSLTSAMSSSPHNAPGFSSPNNNGQSQIADNSSLLLPSGADNPHQTPFSHPQQHMMQCAGRRQTDRQTPPHQVLSMAPNGGPPHVSSLSGTGASTAPGSSVSHVSQFHTSNSHQRVAQAHSPSTPVSRPMGPLSKLLKGGLTDAHNDDTPSTTCTPPRSGGPPLMFSSPLIVPPTGTPSAAPPRSTCNSELQALLQTSSVLDANYLRELIKGQLASSTSQRAPAAPLPPSTNLHGFPK